MPQPSRAERVRPWSGRRGALALAGTAVALLGLAQTTAGADLRELAGLDGSTDDYLELYFAEPSLLPAAVAAGPATITLPVTFANRSDRARRYDWVLAQTHGGAQTDGGAPTPLRRGSVEIDSLSRTDLVEPVTFDCARPRTRLELQVPERAVSIGFWVSCS